MSTLVDGARTIEIRYSRGFPPIFLANTSYCASFYGTSF
jgi:hypothetical protein